SLGNNQTQQFTTTAKDQFGNPLASQPAITWSLGTGSLGSLSSSGLYTAPGSGSGPATVQAKSGSVTGTARGTVTPAGIPAVPGGVTATGGNGQVSLSWTASSGATSYNIYRATTSAGEGSTPYRSGLTSTSFTDSGLNNGTTYYYQVTAVNSAGQS